MRSLVRYTALPFFIISAIYYAHYVIAYDVSRPLSLFIFGTSTFIIVLFLEQLYPFKQTWKKLGKEEVKDIFHGLIGTDAGAVIGNWTNATILALVIDLFEQSDMTFLWPSEISFFLQILLIILVSDFGRYWQHRIHHLSSSLWQFHELHHNDNVLNVFKTSRSHLVERVLQQIWMYLLLYLLGVNAEALYYFLMINTVLGVFTHSNLDIECGLFEHILMTPKNHKIHHSVDLKLGNTNFGSFTVIWDRVFGTYTHSKKLEKFEDIEVGVPYLQKHESLFRQVLMPFKRSYLIWKKTFS